MSEDNEAISNFPVTPANLGNFLRAWRDATLSLIYFSPIGGNFLLISPKTGNIDVIFGDGCGAQIQHHPDISHF